MKTRKNLINNIIGQLEGIDKMIDEGKDCQKVIVQMKAVRSAMANVMEKYMEENISLCLKSKSGKKSRKDLENLVAQLIRNK